MGAEEALDLADGLVFQEKDSHFNNLQRAVFQQAWVGKTYEAIAEQLGYSESHIKETGNELWKLLTEALGEKVTKKNFRAALERKQRSLLQQSTASNSQIVDIPVIDPIAHTTSLPTTSTDPNFVGREGAIAQITSLVKQGAKIITICAPGGVGKTTLAWQYLHNQGFDKILEIWMAKEIQHINSVESEVERWLQQDFGEEPGRDFGVNLERLRQKLRDPNQRIGILIDNLEPALDKNGRFIENRRPYVDLLRVLCDPGARSLTLITSRERLCEPCIEIKDYRLEGLDEASWQEFFSNHGIQADSADLKKMHHAYAGNAKAMQILSSAIQIDFEGDLEEFWKENQTDLLLEPTLESLVSEQFNRLQAIYPEAYRLLCRLGCFRYQDVPKVPLNGVLNLAWDIEGKQQRRVVKALQDRALVETNSSEYWLHPIIRDEAIIRLKNEREWGKINQRVAEFWTNNIEFIETIQDALKAFEAYYCYVEISDFESAGEIIAKERDNKWVKRSPLGASFYRLGLSKHIKSSILLIINRMNPSYVLGRLYIILGDIYSIDGCINQAIGCHLRSEEAVIRYQNSLSSKCEQYQAGLRRMRFKISSLFKRGLCHIYLWNLEEALSLFQEVYSFSGKVSQYYSIRSVQNSLFCLAFLYSCLGLKKEAMNFAQEVESTISDFTEWGAGHKFFFLGVTYRNLGDYNKSFDMYHKGISYAEESHYIQARAKGLYGLAELYREQENFKQAVSYHSESIKLLKRIAVRSDLAEAYFQFGLTYRAMSDFEKGVEYRDKAINLFEEMEAPRQVERVRLAFR